MSEQARLSVVLVVDDDPFVRRLLALSLGESYEVREAGDGAVALTCLEEDHQFLLKGGVFSKDLIEAWISYKRRKEVDPMRLRPHPYEYVLYYDV